jgi:hypothetical protein
VPDDDDRPRDASSAADRGWPDAAHPGASWADALAPDDIRDLVEDIAAYHREQRAARRRDLFGRVLAGRCAPVLALIVAAVVAVAIVAGISAVTAGSQRPSPLPLTKSTVAVGQPGSLLPNTPLTDLGGGTTPAESLRPAVVALIPPTCNCQPTLISWSQQAAADHLRMVVIAPSAQDPEATALGGRIAAGSVYYDRAGQLAHDFDAQGLTGVLVNRDGSVFRVVAASATTPVQLGSLLQQMLQRTSG